MKKFLSSYWIRSAFYTFLQRFSLTFFGVINFIFLTRSLSTTQLGTWALFLIITSVFEATKTNLLKNAHIKFASSTNIEDEKTLVSSASFVINLSISIIFILSIIIFSNWIGQWLNTGPELGKMLMWFIPGLIFTIIFSHLEAIQQSNLDFKGGFVGHFIRQGTFFIVILVYYFTNTSLPLVHLVMYQSLSIALGSIGIYIFSRKYLLYEFKFRMLWVKKILNYGGYIFGSGMVANIFANIDQLMTAKLLLPTNVAYYNVASRINGLVDIPSYAASEVLFPKTARAFAEEGKEKIKYLFEKMVSVLLAFSLPAALTIIIFPQLVIRIIAGPAYSAAIPILQLYMIAGILRPVQNQAANLLNSIGKTKLVFILNTCFLVVLLVMNYFCLLKFGFYGAAIGTLVSSLLNFIAWYFIMRKEVSFQLSNVITYTVENYKTIYKQAGLLWNGIRKKTA